MTLLQLANDETIKSGFELFDKLSPKFFMRLLINILSVTVLVRFIYIRHYRNRDKVLTFTLFNMIIFLITFLMNKVEMSLGAAFGLFAVFTMLRYRTEGISTNDMTYLFLVIAIGLLNAVTKGNWDELILLNLILLATTFLLESNILTRKETSREIVYEKIELIKPESRTELIQDLETRLGIKINHIQVGRINLLRDSAEIIVFFYE
ncbi:MAG: DUF4956 domain-containing protein [Bacteroidetes bacterium]|nr:DUF4956 domain-containing protein [Bacteroidota bacterium]